MAELGAAELGQMTDGMSDSQRMIFQSQYSSERKDRGTGLLLAVIGWDRFWLGQIGLGILKYITAGGCGIWWLIDIFTAGTRCDDYNRQKAQEIAAAMRVSDSSASPVPDVWPARARAEARAPEGRPIEDAAIARREAPKPLDGGFLKGATLIENPSTAMPPAYPSKSKTIFDPGPATNPQAQLSKLTGWLVSFSLTPSGDDFRLREGRNIIGSEAVGSDIVVRDQSLSAKHAIIICRDGHIQLRDNDSTNGTYVNGEDIFGKGAVDLGNLDVVRFGRVEFRLFTLTQPPKDA